MAGLGARTFVHEDARLDKAKCTKHSRSRSPSPSPSPSLCVFKTLGRGRVVSLGPGHLAIPINPVHPTNPVNHVNPVNPVNPIHVDPINPKHELSLALCLSRSRSRPPSLFDSVVGLSGAPLCSLSFFSFFLSFCLSAFLSFFSLFL